MSAEKPGWLRKGPKIRPLMPRNYNVTVERFYTSRGCRPCGEAFVPAVVVARSHPRYLRPVGASVEIAADDVRLGKARGEIFQLGDLLCAHDVGNEDEQQLLFGSAGGFTREQPSQERDASGFG